MRRLALAAAVLGGAVLLQGLLPAAEAARASWLSILPPLLAISLALVLKEVLLSLFLGVWLGAAMLADGAVVPGLLRVVDTFIRGALVDSDHISILLFSMLLGGMVGVMGRAGGTRGIVRRLEPLATTPRRAQVVAWVMGVLIFFDDYSNTLIVGNAMRPITDRHRISREKLAYLVDSTAAPVATLALVSTWVGYQVSLLGDALGAAGSSYNPFGIFLGSLAYAYYPVFALAITLTVATMGRDLGPMLRAERRARAGQLLAPSAQPLADYESALLEPRPETPCRWYNAGLPVLAVVVATLVGLWVTGAAALRAEGAEIGLRRVVGASDPFTALLWASLLGLALALVLAVWQRLLTPREGLEATLQGFKSMLLAMVVLTLAWSLGAVCSGLQTAQFLVGAIGPHLAPGFIPPTVFVVAAAVSFATGTSWGTMAILTPLAVPLVLAAPVAAGQAALVASTAAAILGGSVFGDHCSPISDTTIMSSMSSGCDHVDHVRTQLPYALLGALLALLVGYLPDIVLTAAPPWISMPVGLVLVVALVRWLGRSPEDAEGALKAAGTGPFGILRGNPAPPPAAPDEPRRDTEDGHKEAPVPRAP